MASLQDTPSEFTNDHGSIMCLVGAILDKTLVDELGFFSAGTGQDFKVS